MAIQQGIPDSNTNVYTVCENEVRAFGPYENGSDRRPLLWVREYGSHGAAAFAAQESQEFERGRQQARR